MVYSNRKSTHSKVDAPEDAYLVIRPRLSRWQTGEAILFLLMLSFSKKVQKRYNKSTKGKEQSQYTDDCRNDFESCHNNAPPFLIYSGEPVNWFGRLPPCHGYSSTCFHVRDIISICLYKNNKWMKIKMTKF